LAPRFSSTPTPSTSDLAGIIYHSMNTEAARPRPRRATADGTRRDAEPLGGAEPEGEEAEAEAVPEPDTEPEDGGVVLVGRTC
jgi:hypothetical protein